MEFNHYFFLLMAIHSLVTKTVEVTGDVYYDVYYPDKPAKALGQRRVFAKDFKITATRGVPSMGAGLGMKQQGWYTRSNAISVKYGKFEEDCLKAHNKYRVKHGVPVLTLSKELCAYSKEWADYLAATDSFDHRQNRKYGENLFMKWSSEPNLMVTGNEPVDSWYSEIIYHVFGKEPTSLKSGHFTQVIWKESKTLGVAWARSKTGKIVVVANYYPHGNVIGKFAENVPPPKY